MEYVLTFYFGKSMHGWVNSSAKNEAVVVCQFGDPPG